MYDYDEFWEMVEGEEHEANKQHADDCSNLTGGFQCDCETAFIRAHMEGKQVGFTLGVLAAREAVKALPDGDEDGIPLPPYMMRNKALAAIDALRGAE